MKLFPEKYSLLKGNPKAGMSNFVYGALPGVPYEEQPEVVKEVNHMLYWLSLVDREVVTWDEFLEQWKEGF